MARLLAKYRDEVVPALKEKLGRENVHSIPKLEKIVVSMGVGRAIKDRKILEEAVEHLTLLTGQKPQITRARKSISAFQLREGVEVGCRVTLRGQRMYEFFDRLISLALPRVRDFQGVKANAFDGNGNYSMGLNEQLVFPEIHPDSVKNVQGMNITFVTTTNSNDDAKAFLQEMGMPFQKAETK